MSLAPLAPWRRALPWLACAGVVLGVCCALWWPVPLHLSTHRALTAFGDSHVWVFERIHDALVAGGLPADGCAAGYPQTRTMRAIGWAAALAYLPLRAVAAPLAAANLVQLASLPLSAVAAMALVRRWTEAPPWTAAALGACWALCPTLLGTFATAEISNTQAWILPLFLLVAHESQAAPGRRARLGATAAAGAVGLAAALTSPYYALALPLLAGGLVLLVALHERRAKIENGLLIVVLGLCQLPAAAYYSPAAAGGGASMFRPARRAVALLPTLPHPPPVAQLDQLLVDTVAGPGSPFETVHAVSTGLALAGLAAVGLWRRRAGWGAGLALALGGLLMCLGPALYAGGALLTVGGRPLVLPFYALEQLGWPTAQGGLYYRYAVVMVLGAVILAAGALRGRRGTAVAWLALGLQLAQGLAETGPLWPRPVAPLVAPEDAAALAALRGTDGGAVLDLPLQGPTDAHFGQAALLRAVVHGRPTTALPRGNLRPEDPARGRLRRAMGAPDVAAAHALLRAAGYAAVVLPAELARFSAPPRDELEAALGPPTHDGGLVIWSLGPATPDCAPLEGGPPPGGSGR